MPTPTPDQWQMLSPYLDEALAMSDEERSHWLSSLHSESPDLAKQLDGENEILGDFLVCPFTRPRPGKMQLMCIESAKNVVVKKREQ